MHLNIDKIETSFVGRTGTLFRLNHILTYNSFVLRPTGIHIIYFYGSPVLQDCIFSKSATQRMLVATVLFRACNSKMRVFFLKPIAK
jgi:hypothetical protein